MIPPKEFLKKINPFSFLGEEELCILVSGLEIVLFPRDKVIYAKGSTGGDVYLVFSGLIGLYDDDELVDHVSRGELFGILGSMDDSPALFDARCQEDSLCYVIKNESFQKIFQSNGEFASFFKTFMDKRFRSFAQLTRQNALPSTGHFLVPVASILTKKPVTCSEHDSIVEATRAMQRNKVGSIVVVDGSMAPRGIFTSKDLRNAILSGDREDPVGRFMSHPVVALDGEKALFDAYTTMINHPGIDHLVVVHDERVEGVLTNKDILSQLEPSSSILAFYRKIMKAGEREELKTAFAQVKSAVARLAQGNVHFHDLSRMITSVNDTVVQKIVEMVLKEHSLKDFVWVHMGSSGRKEQILTTDQDNALIHREETDPRAFAERMNDLLDEMGIPRCPARYMASNSRWRLNLEGWKDCFKNWFAEPKPDHLRYLTVFLDMRPISGNTEIYQELLDHVYHSVTNQAVRFLAHDATLMEPPIGIFGIKNLDKGLHLKRYGIFPIVNGIRVLALEHRILGITNTRMRMETLHKMGVLSADFATSLLEAYEFMQDLRLKHHARALEAQEPLDNKIHAKELHKMDLLVLKESFKIVSSFQKFLKSRYVVERGL